MALNYIGASDKAIKFSFFLISVRVVQNLLNERHSISASKNIPSPCFHVISFVSN